MDPRAISLLGQLKHLPLSVQLQVVAGVLDAIDTDVSGGSGRPTPAASQPDRRTGDVWRRLDGQQAPA
jgi:hypothetical protein